MLKSYDIDVGTIGFVSDEKKMLFPTDSEFEEYMEDLEKLSEEDMLKLQIASHLLPTLAMKELMKSQKEDQN